jgi:hypothetical protein
MATPSVAQLLQAHRARIAHTVARQIQSTVPAYRSMDTEAIAHNSALILDGVCMLLESGDEQTLMKIIGMDIELRQVSGVTVSDYLVAVLCGLPVIRRYLVREAASVEQGLERYEQFERVALPLFGRVVATFLRTSEDQITVPEKQSPLEELRSELHSGELFAYEIFPVENTPAKVERLEDTDPGRRHRQARDGKQKSAQRSDHGRSRT